MKNTLVVYTAIIGPYDTLKDPEVITPDCDYVCFTDQDLKSDIWQIRKVIPLYKDNTRTARKYKILPHRFLPEYDTSIWVDGNMTVIGDARSYVNKFISDEINMVTHSHMDCFDKWNCVYQEANAIFYFGTVNGGNFKDDPEIIRKQMQRYVQAGYPEDNTLASTCTIIRRHGVPLIQSFGERWWQEMKYGSKRDQLGFNYAAWAMGNVPFAYTGDDSRNNEFAKHVPHLK